MTRFANIREERVDHYTTRMYLLPAYIGRTGYYSPRITYVNKKRVAPCHQTFNYKLTVSDTGQGLLAKPVLSGGGGPSATAAGLPRPGVQGRVQMREVSLPQHRRYKQEAYHMTPPPPPMDQITVKTPNPRCRLYWCLIEFVWGLQGDVFYLS
jgi:hypothetical protein